MTVSRVPFPPSLPRSNQQTAAQLRRYGWRRARLQLARNGTTWEHPAHEGTLLTVSRVSDHFQVTGHPLTLLVPQTLSEARAEELLATGLDLYGLDADLPLRDVLVRCLDWFDAERCRAEALVVAAQTRVAAAPFKTETWYLLETISE